MYCCSCSTVAAPLVWLVHARRAFTHFEKLCDKFHKEISQIHIPLQVLFDLHRHNRLRYRAGVTGNRALIEEILREIHNSGGHITFVRFMDLALYHPRHGYYTSGRERIGRKGDYFTSVSVGPLFGRLLAKQFLKWREELGNPTDFEVIEFGGHRGQLRDDVLAAVLDLRYRVGEVGDALPDSIVGCVFSNEFLDALPVHRVFGDREVYVTASFKEELGPLSDARLLRLPEGYRSEFNLRALDWLTDVARRLKRGYVLTIDYGFESAEYFAPHHKDGHLQCYYRHTKSGNPYQHVGEQDITAHVEFTSLIELGKKFDLEPVSFTDQAHYLLQIGESEISEIATRTAGQFSQERAAIHQLIHPELMGRTFKVLVQRKKVG
jgi:SAM-dependent MidA family methyltransferase